MILPMAEPASEIRPGDLVFYCEKRDVGGWLIVDEAKREDRRVAVSGHAYPDDMGAGPVIVDLGSDEYVGIVRGIAPEQYATFEEAERLAAEARR